MTETRTMTLAEIEDISYRALSAVGTNDNAARSLAVATAETEAQGIASHGLAYIPIYAEHVTCGKVDGQAQPVIDTPKPGLVTADAATGFAHPAIDAGFAELAPRTRDNGIAGLAVRNSYNCGVLGYHTARFAADENLVVLGFTNAPASIAPSGGKTPLFGTNPFSIAVPDGAGDVAWLIDQSASAIARSEVMKHAREGKPIPLGWALDANGEPTTDAEAAMKGSMAPSGGYKGVGIALLVETMAAALSGATLGRDASPFSGPVGGPPKTGQFFLAIDPGTSSGGAFAEKVSAITEAFADQPGARLPGVNRRSKRVVALENGVAVSTATLARIEALL